jgi:hypothetical protein
MDWLNQNSHGFSHGIFPCFMGVSPGFIPPSPSTLAHSELGDPGGTSSGVDTVGVLGVLGYENHGLMDL